MATDSRPPAITQLIRQLDRLRGQVHPWPRNPTLGRLNVDGIVSAIRAGGDAELGALVQLCQEGDGDAATLALWAVHPLMCQAVRNHVRRVDLLDDDFLAFGYAVLRDINAGARPLAPKIVSRTLRRALRQYERLGCQEVSLEAALEYQDAPDGSGRRESREIGGAFDEVPDRALARLAVRDLRTALEVQMRQGRIARWQWDLVVDARVGRGDPAAVAARYGLSRTAARSNISRTVGRLRQLVA